MRRPARQQALALEATATLVLVKVVLGSLPFEHWRRLLGIDASHLPPPPDRLRVAEIVWAVDRTSALWPGWFTCLPRALTVLLMLHRRRWTADLELGVNLDPNGAFQAHAWVVHDGEILIGALPDLSRFHRLPWRGRQGHHE